MYRKGFKDFLSVGSSVVLLFFAAPLIDNYQHEFLAKKGIFERDILCKMLGESKKALSDYADMKGDEYLHGGIVPRDKSECAKIEEHRRVRDHHHAAESHHYGECPHCRDYHEHPHKEDAEPRSLSKLNILPYIGERINIAKHIHLHGEEEKELLPWFYYAVRLNPENVDAYVIGGYWIGIRLNKPDEAIKFLKEGQIHNPNSWQIYTQLGETYFLGKKDYRQALVNLQKAHGLLTEENSDKFNRREVYTFIADCYEKLGQIEKTLEFYRKVFVLFPKNELVQKKIESLSSRIQYEHK